MLSKVEISNITVRALHIYSKTLDTIWRTCSVYKRITKYKSMKCDIYWCVFVCTQNSTNCILRQLQPMRCVGVCQKCGQRSEICQLPVVDATLKTMLTSPSFPASQSQAANQSSVTIQNFEASQNSESIQNSLEATQKTEQAEKNKATISKERTVVP